MIHARITFWMLLVGLTLPLVEASAQVPAPPTTPPVTPRPAVVPPGTQQPGTVRPGTTVPPTPSPTTPGTPLTTADPLATPPANLDAANSAYSAINNQPAASSTFGAGGAAAAANAPRLGILQMIGDQEPFQTLHKSATVPAVPTPPSPFPPKNPPNPPSPRQASALAPSVRGLKIAENQSPQPQDRIFYSFNYYSNLNASIDKRFDTPIKNLQAYRSIFGFEKTFDSGRASFGLIMPLDTLSANSTIQGNFAKPGGTSTAVGDLSIFTKFIVRQNIETGSLFSAGLVVTAPTGPASFAGANYISALHTTQIQPYIGYIFRRERFFLHGFSAFSFPANPNDVTLAYNDLGVGYFLYQDKNENPTHWLTAIVPTSEIHINTPLNHQNPYNANDIAGSANVVNLTQGLNMEFNRRSILTIGIATPITSPRPFDLEALILFNFRFGGSRQTLTPILGG